MEELYKKEDKMREKSDKKIVYTIIEPNCDTLVHSTTPSGAAKKVYSKHIRPFLSKNDDKTIHMVRIQNTDGKIFEYEVQEIKKNEIVLRGDKEIIYTYNVNVKSRNIHKTKDSIKQNRKSISPIHSYNSSRSPSPCKKSFVFFKRSVPK